MAHRWVDHDSIFFEVLEECLMWLKRYFSLTGDEGIILVEKTTFEATCEFIDKMLEGLSCISNSEGHQGELIKSLECPP